LGSRACLSGPRGSWLSLRTGRERETERKNGDSSQRSGWSLHAGPSVSLSLSLAYARPPRATESIHTSVIALSSISHETHAIALYASAHTQTQPALARRRRLLTPPSRLVFGSPLSLPKPNTKTKNQNNSAARSIKLEDAAPLPEGLSLAPGAVTSATFKKLDVGATAKHSYDLVPSSGGRAFRLPRASVSYAAFDGDKEAPKQAASSSPVLYVETPAEAAVRHVLTAGAYGTLGLVRTPEQWRSVAIFGVLGGALFGGSAVWGKAKAAGAAQRRTKALAALEKEK
jgi:hypothetical protein